MSLEDECAKWLTTHNPNNVHHLADFVRQKQKEAVGKALSQIVLSPLPNWNQNFNKAWCHIASEQRDELESIKSKILEEL